MWSKGLSTVGVLVIACAIGPDPKANVTWQADVGRTPRGTMGELSDRKQAIREEIWRGLLGDETPIVTTVHELQLVDEVPTEPHDRRVLTIVTPERVIRTRP